MENSYTKWKELEEERVENKTLKKGSIDSYMIKKIFTTSKGRKTHVLLTNGQSEVLERTNKTIMVKLVSLLNENSEEGCGIYELITIHNERKEL